MVRRSTVMTPLRPIAVMTMRLETFGRVMVVEKLPRRTGTRVSVPLTRMVSRAALVVPLKVTCREAAMEPSAGPLIVRLGALTAGLVLS